MPKPLRLFALLFAAGCSELPGEGPGDTDDALLSEHTDPATAPTWHADVAPLLAQRCGACHREGALAPFSVETYDEAARWGRAIRQSVLDGTMPPFDAAETEECAPEAPWKHDPRLTREEKDLVAAWVDAGSPEGAPAPPPPVPEADTLASPDAVLAIEHPYTAQGTRDAYMCFRVTVPLEEDVWLTGVEVRPDNDLVVHHVLVWSDPKDQSAALVDDEGKYPCSGTPDVYPTELVGTWTPGAGVTRTPEGVGIPLKKGASLVINVHYHPTGAGPEVDQTAVALQWTTKPPRRHATWFLVDVPFGARVLPGPNDRAGAEFRIPPGVADHQETVLLDTADYLPIPLPIFAVTPHMHYLGRDMLVTLRRDDPRDDTCLVHAPTYRFNWQSTYVYDADLDDLPKVMPGDRLEVRCTYDNSPSNPFLRDALAASGREEPGEVRWGEETSDEMCMAMVGLIIPPIDISEVMGGLF